MNFLQQAEEYREANLEGKARGFCPPCCCRNPETLLYFLNKALPTGSAFDLIKRNGSG